MDARTDTERLDLLIKISGEWTLCHDPMGGMWYWVEDVEDNKYPTARAAIDDMFGNEERD